MTKRLTFLDLFAGAGGLSEGFIRANFLPIAHVELDTAACFTLKTRMAYHWLKKHGKSDKYEEYLEGKIQRSELYSLVPPECINSVINEEISKETIQIIFNQIDVLLNGKKLDLIVGGPPCQAYSVIGRSADKKGMVGDKRNYLYKHYAEFLKHYTPKYFVFENVPGLLSAKDQDGERHLDKMIKVFEACKYKTEFRVLSAEEYGVPQKRKRIILVGKYDGEKGFYPEPVKWSPRVKVKDVFSDLPELQAGEGTVLPSPLKKCTKSYLKKAGIRNGVSSVTFHNARPHTEQDLEIYRQAADLWNKEKRRLDYNDLPERLKTHNQRDSFLDRFKVVAGDLACSHTLVAHISKDGHYYIHPDIKQNRSLTPREAARLQTFPDNYFFESVSGQGSRTAAFRQIGNAVPVLLAQKIAEKLKEIWK